MNSLVEMRPMLRLPARSKRTRCRRRHDRRSAALQRRLTRIVAIALSGWFIASPCGAQEVTSEQMQGLDEQVQEIKTDVLGIAAELNLLEERLLFPSNTQIAVFVSLAEEESFRVDSVRIQLDGELVAHHIYAFKELEALQKGGVQRIYTGNVATGEHRLDVTVAGKLPSGEDFSTSQGFDVRKAVEPKLVELLLAANSSDDAIRLRGL